MALYNLFKSRGYDKSANPSTGQANLRSTPMLAIVKDNVDPNKTGRIRAYLLDNSGADENDSSNWRPLQYMTPYFGRTDPQGASDSYGEYKLNPSSYGMWFSSPEIGSVVVCIFVNGDVNYGYYIGCVPDPVAMRMVPAIGANFEKEDVVFNGGEANKLGGAIRVPVTNMNTNDTATADGPNYVDAAKPCHSYSAAVMFQQGILRDPIRGPISSSSQRETPSRVGWGVSTPGRPIYQGGYDDSTLPDNLEADPQNLKIISRRGGHSIVMDDGDILGRDQLVRIRTALGHQLLMSDDGQILMLLHANGQTYIELGKEGTVDVYSTNSVNIRTQGDLNLHADNNVNIHAAKDLKIQAQNIQINSETNYNLRVGADYQTSVFGKHTTKSNGPLAMESVGEASMVSGAIAYVSGTKVNLNTGKPSTVPAEVPIIPIIAHTDTLLDKEKGYIAAPGKLSSIVSRAPAHAPWAHASQGVDVETNLDADANLPAEPTAGVNAANQVATTPAVPVDAGTINAVPNPAGAASAALDKGTTSAMLGVAATAAAATAQEAVKQGAAIITDAAGKAQAVVGQFAQTAEQLETGGILKPGAAKLVDSLVAGGASAAEALTSNLFTGLPGAANLDQLKLNVGAQSSSMVANFQKAQSALTSVGAMTGKESGSQVAGVVLSAAKEGVNTTLNALSTLTGGGGNTFLTGGAGLDALKTGPFSWISSGNFAAKLSGLTSGLGSIGQSVQAMVKGLGLGDIVAQTKGAAAAAFAAIAGSFKAFKPGVPQNLKKIAQDAAAQTAENAAAPVNGTDAGTSILDSVNNGISAATGAAAGLASDLKQSVGDALTAGAGSLTGALDTAAGTLTSTLGGSVGSELSNSAAALTQDPTGSLTNPAGAINAFVGGALDTANKAVTALSNPAASLASGIDKMPGGQGSIANLVDMSLGSAASLIPGVDKVKGLLNEAQTAAMNGLPDVGGLLNQVDSSLSALVSAGLPAGAASQLQAAISSVGGGAVKLPSIAIGTTNRASITSSINNLLGDPGIPPPNYSGTSNIDAQIAKIEALRKESDDRNKRLAELKPAKDEAEAKWRASMADFKIVKQLHEEGSPIYEDAGARMEADYAAMRKIDDEYYAIASGKA